MLKMHYAVILHPFMSSWFGASLYTGMTTLMGLELAEDARS
jgi:hypothetical protein